MNMHFLPISGKTLPADAARIYLNLEMELLKVHPPHQETSGKRLADTAGHHTPR